MQLVSPWNSEVSREFELRERRLPGDVTHTMVYFLTPADVRCAAFLAHSSPDRPDEQWFFLPQMNRTWPQMNHARMIPAQARRARIMGSDFTYHELDVIQKMIAWTEGDAASRLTGEETVEGVRTYRIELTPRRADIGFQLIVLWLGCDDLVPSQLEFHEQWGTSKKRVRQSDIRMVGRIPVAYRVEAVSLEEGTRTVLEPLAVQFDERYGDEAFTQAAMERCPYRRPGRHGRHQSVPHLQHGLVVLAELAEERVASPAEREIAGPDTEGVGDRIRRAGEQQPTAPLEGVEAADFQLEAIAKKAPPQQPVKRVSESTITSRGAGSRPTI